jgi:hypothetical protein
VHTQGLYDPDCVLEETHMKALNRKRYTTFKNHCRGAQITEIHVHVEERGHQVRLKYNGRDRKNRLFNGEWIVEKKDRSEEEIQGEIEEFLEMAGKDFAIKRHGLSEDETEPRESEK